MNEMDYFEKHGCILIENFIDEQTVDLIREYFQNKIFRGEWNQNDNKVDKTSKFSYYGDPLIEVLLLRSREAVENIVGKELIATYSYSRVYQPGEQLLKHVDRAACEISVSVNVVTHGEFSPIYTQYGQNSPEKHILNPGDAVVYKGCEVAHWREPLTDDQLNVQFMLHYVDKNGPNAEHDRDKRPAYGFNLNKRRQ